MAINDGQGSAGVPDRGWQLWITSVVMVIVAGFFVAGRLAARVSRNKLGWDDYSIIGALISSIALSITEIEAVENGYGRHAKSLTHNEIIFALKWFYVAQIMYKVVITLNKVSILCLYLRIFIDKTFRWICFSGIAFIASSGMAFILATIFQCTPVAGYWDRAIKGAHCIKSEPFWFSYAMINIVTDVAILALPVRQIIKLQLPRRDKIGLMGVFLIGGFVCVTSIVRTTTLASSAKNPDATWGPIPATIWSVVEANTGTICACLPMLKQPLMVLFPRLFSNTPIDQFGSHKNGLGNTVGSKSHSRAPRSATDYPQWAMADGTIMSSVIPGKQGHLRNRESEEGIIAEAGGITRTTDVSVRYHAGSDGNSTPSTLKDHEIV